MIDLDRFVTSCFSLRNLDNLYSSNNIIVHKLTFLALGFPPNFTFAKENKQKLLRKSYKNKILLKIWAKFDRFRYLLRHVFHKCLLLFPLLVFQAKGFVLLRQNITYVSWQKTSRIIHKHDKLLNYLYYLFFLLLLGLFIRFVRCFFLRGHDGGRSWFPGKQCTLVDITQKTLRCLG